MITITGEVTNAKVFTNKLEDTAKNQIKQLVSSDLVKNTQVRIMPDVHAGKGSTIGTSIKLPDNKADWLVSPSIVGVDIGCGMMSYKLNNSTLDLEEIDKIISQYIPTGFNHHESPINKEYTDNLIDSLLLPVLKKHKEYISNALGTLGGGNHFIEIAKDEQDNYWLTVHSGSRTLGAIVATYYQDLAYAEVVETIRGNKETRNNLIAKYKAQGKQKELNTVLHQLSRKPVPDKSPLNYLTGDNLDLYLHDLKLAQQYAHKSRKLMLDTIVAHAGLDIIPEETFDSIHNYIDIEKGIIRKGATDASAGKRLIIPINMHEGSLICVGKGNSDWNYSAPHGAGRKLSRTVANNTLSLEEYKDSMTNIYTTSVGYSTLDEAPMAYKSLTDITDNIGDTVDILHHIKPVYNYKAH